MSDYLLLPVRLLWVDQFPSSTVYIDAYDDGERYYVTELWRGVMRATLAESMPEATDSLAVLDALTPVAGVTLGAEPLYAITELMGGREATLIPGRFGVRSSYAGRRPIDGRHI